MKDQKYIDILIEEFKLKDVGRSLGLKELKTKSSEIRRIRAEYEKSHPEVVKEYHQHLMEARIKYLGESIYEYFNNLPPFNGDPNKIPDIPVMPIWFLKEKVWPGLIRAGAIPKKDLIPGKEYIGSCRNSSKATWDGEKFIYTRTKFGDSFEDTIKHFEDDDEFDVFIPIYEKS